MSDTPSVYERIEGALERTRERLPTLSAALLIATFSVGAGAGVMLSKPWHRAAVNKEWRQRLAASSEAVRKIIAQGNADADVLDNKILAELGVYDDKLSVAEAALEHASRTFTEDDARRAVDGRVSSCRIPAWWLRDQ